jgi:hypothetical protein
MNLLLLHCLNHAPTVNAELREKIEAILLLP